jgi:hypothetical protein
MAPLASDAGMPVNVTTPVPDVYAAAAPTGRFPMLTPLNPLASVSAYVSPAATDGPVFRNTTVPLTDSPAFTLAGKLTAVVTSATSAPPTVAVALSAAAFAPWLVLVPITLITVLLATPFCVYATVIPLVPLPLAIAPLANVAGMPVNVTTPVPDAYDVVAPVGRLPMLTPLNPLASVSVYVSPAAVDGPALRNTTVPFTASLAFTLAGKLTVEVTSATSAPPTVVVALSAAAFAPWLVLVLTVLLTVLLATLFCV